MHVILTEDGVVIGMFESYGEAETWLGAGEGEIRPITLIDRCR